MFHVEQLRYSAEQVKGEGEEGRFLYLLLGCSNGG